MKTLVKRSTPNGWHMPSLFSTSPFFLLNEMLNDDFLRVGDYSMHLPAVNISESEDQYTVELSAPGFSKEDFKLELNDGNLVITAEKKEEKSESNKKFSRKEFSYGSFRRMFKLDDDVNEDAVSANYENGILRINLPKKEEAKSKPSREIKIS
jgi:HSP20 family protein